MIMRILIGAMLIPAVTLGTGWPQSTSRQLRLSDIKAQQTQEAIFASAPCRRAVEAPQGRVIQPYPVDPKTLVQNLNTLIERSDDVILAGVMDHAVVLSPSGEGPATYFEVRVIRSWKGQYHSGDALTFGMPIGMVPCEPTSRPNWSSFWVEPDDFGVTTSGPYVYVLFLRESKDIETKSVQGLRLTAGEGVQGMFLIQVPEPPPSDAERYCSDALHGSVRHCDSYLGTSRSPVMDPYKGDPLASKYGGMPVSDFLREVQSVAARQGLVEKSLPQ